MPELSIIIPTHNRPKILKQCLEHLEKQTIADKIEVIVVDDCKANKETISVMESKWHIPIDFCEIEKAQQGIARNRGVKHARASTCLFIGDDIFLEPNACELHLKAKGQDAVLGFTTWDPAVGITQVMEWLEKSGWQFCYPMIEEYAHAFLPKEIQHRFTYTSHISLPTETAKKISFRSDVTMYGWEDIEWGMRLRDAGVKLFYEPDAKALHHHRITLEESFKRMETLGQSVAKLGKDHLDFDRMPRGLKRLAYELASKMPTMAGRHRKAFLQGIKASTE